MIAHINLWFNNFFSITQKVAIIDIQENTEDISKLRQAHPAQTILLIKMDVANRQGIEKTYDELKKAFGSIDIVVNVAGVFNDQDVQRTILVNLVIKNTMYLMVTILKTVLLFLTGIHRVVSSILHSLRLM